MVQIKSNKSCCSRFLRESLFAPRRAQTLRLAESGLELLLVLTGKHPTQFLQVTDKRINLYAPRPDSFAGICHKHPRVTGCTGWCRGIRPLPTPHLGIIDAEIVHGVNQHAGKQEGQMADADLDRSWRAGSSTTGAPLPAPVPSPAPAQPGWSAAVV